MVITPDTERRAEQQLAPPTGNPLLRILALTRPQWARLLSAGMLGALASASAVALMALSAWLISRAAQHPAILTLMVAIVGVRTFGIARGVLRYLERLSSHEAALRVLEGLRVAIVTRLALVAPAGLPLWRRSDLLGRTITDVDDIQDLLLRGLLPLFGAAVVCGGATGLFFLILPSAGLVLLACLVAAVVLIPIWLVRRGKDTEAVAASNRAERDALVADTIAASTELNLLGAMGVRLDALRQHEKRAASCGQRRAREAGIAAGSAVGLMGLASIGAIVAAAPQVSAGQLPAVLLAVVALTPLALVEVVTAVGTASSALSKATAAAVRVLAVLDTPDPMPASALSVKPLPANSKGRLIEMRGVSARWPGTDRDAISDVSLVLRPGTSTCLLGPSGSGKSTVLAVLLGFLRPTAGTIIIDGQDASQYEPQEVRNLMGWTGTDAHVFATSVAENLRFARPDADDVEVASAMREAGLGEWLGTLPRGLDTQMGEQGISISGGERQRLLLARALLSHRPVLLADEPTAHVDEPTAAALSRMLLGRRENGQAVLLVTHREADAAAADVVVRMSGGVVSGHSR
ncbi:thiol reductant ABC exporter subunit CydC [Nakamurella antarctica]|uniref:Thiol reductant ABC exporter subunit CydC n=1 Tax=Nakamurella antarctica TaxID=1902245 RepID=A0A3G8ZQP5_9ACTN|nr:thiol reductant ABC exporter subunit CydC [Nakamurella antarctica]AZI56874.1 thiol reductant ABC exporter subunit CydC [Nakamurella antarctica]